MTAGTFRALVARDAPDGQSVGLERLSDDDLPEGDVVVDVAYSSLNYKDGLALKGLNGILRHRPIIPGIDLAGTVAASTDSRFGPGDEVVLTGWGVGEKHSGGFSERARLRGEWLTTLPSSLSSRSAMAIGTAGLTAMLCVLALERYGIEPGGEVVVTGAAGGVGSVSILLLSRLGYRVTAATGRAELEPFLRSLGASSLVARADLQSAGRPLQKERWDAGVDTVGGTVLANVLTSIRYGGAVAACGLAGGSDLPATVFPFILRNVALLGVDSVHCPMKLRDKAWGRLSELVTEADTEHLSREVTLEQLPDLADAILRGDVQGRILVRVRT